MNLPHIFIVGFKPSVMIVKKALQHVEYLLTQRRKQVALLCYPSGKWNEGDDVVKKMAAMLARELQLDINYMNIIRNQLELVQLMTKIICTHPKKAHDIDPCGQKYCTTVMRTYDARIFSFYFFL